MTTSSATNDRWTASAPTSAPIPSIGGVIARTRIVLRLHNVRHGPILSSPHALERTLQRRGTRADLRHFRALHPLHPRRPYPPPPLLVDHLGPWHLRHLPRAARRRRRHRRVAHRLVRL